MNFIVLRIATVKAQAFEFISIGLKGEIRKIVVFSTTENADVFSLGFGDWKEDSLIPDDQVVTNNGDTQKVLATIAKIVDVYTL